MTTAASAAEPAAGSVFAPAKLNLFLHVLGRRADGYHDLESLFVFLDVGDRLQFETPDRAAADGSAADLVLDPDPGIPREQNLIWRALERVRALEPRLPQPRIRVEKALPMQAGLGGGSADAAAVVHWAEGLFPGVDFRGAVARLGADLPPAMDQHARVWRGTGDVPGDRVTGLAGTPVLLLKPAGGVSTAACFQRLSLGRAAAASDFSGPPRGWLPSTRNDLEAPARDLNPDIGVALDALAGATAGEPWLVRMTGSGSTCFALYNEKGPRDAALEAVQRRFPGWWTAAAEIL
ncbi:MAG: 4-(cytidine 5'-diphospho)-2-C-methyl-D-erythritol kinase [Pseudomonadota bacterium]|nr:4-(cytidine 5'-diphospho)-2-C-methyl-D-erythritol kinase [Pseudomonadota bacterium]